MFYYVYLVWAHLFIQNAFLIPNFGKKNPWCGTERAVTTINVTTIENRKNNLFYICFPFPWHNTAVVIPGAFCFSHSTGYIIPSVLKSPLSVSDFHMGSNQTEEGGKNQTNPPPIVDSTATRYQVVKQRPLLQPHPEKNTVFAHSRWKSSWQQN